MLKIRFNPSRDLWLFILPLMFLPAAGLTLVTPIGDLQPSDLLIFPLFGALLLGKQSSRHRPRIKTFETLALFFSIWIVLGAFAIPIKYEYFDSSRVILGSLFKAFKFIIFGYTGILIWKRVRTERDLTKLNYTLLWSGTVIGFSLLYFQFFTSVGTDETQQKAFDSLNSISVTMAILITYLFGVLISRVESARFNQLGWLCITIMAMGFFVSRGRGGWVAAFLGLIYLFIRRGKRASSLFIASAGVAVVVGMYTGVPAFKEEVNKTIGIESFRKSYAYQENEVNAGYRFQTWVNEAEKFINNPVLGTGFFHRGHESKLWITGSHNFWLQIFLESGAVGGALMLMMLYQLWRMAASRVVVRRNYSVLLKAVLITAFIAGLGGEYFYGSTALIVLLAVFASAANFERLKRHNPL